MREGPASPGGIEQTGEQPIAAEGSDPPPSPWPDWMPRLPTLAVWVLTRGALFALVGSFYPWEWYPDLLYESVGVMLGGGNPYVREQVYPPLAMVTFLIPGVLSGSADAFRTVYALFIIAVDLAILLWMRRAERDGFRHAGLAYAIALPAIGPILLLWRFDLLPMLCQVAATVCAVRASIRPGVASRAWTWSWLFLGLGIALKLYLLALVPLWIAWHLGRLRATAAMRATPPTASRTELVQVRTELVQDFHPTSETTGMPWPARWIDLARELALALGPLVLLAAVALVVWGPRSLEPYTYSFGRGVTIDSTPATVIAELGRAGTPTSWMYEPDCFCPVRTAGPGIDAPLRTGSSLLGVVGALGFALWYLRLPSPQRFVAGAAGITALAVFASPILSPQHLVWPLAPLALVAFDPRGRIALGLAMIAAATGAYTMWGPTFQVHVAEYTDLGRALLLVRAAAELGAVLVLVFPTSLELGQARAVRIGRA